MYAILSANYGSVGRVVDEAVQHVSNCVRVVPTRDGRFPLVAGTNTYTLSQPDGSANVSKVMYSCDSAFEVSSK